MKLSPNMISRLAVPKGWTIFGETLNPSRENEAAAASRSAVPTMT